MAGVSMKDIKSRIKSMESTKQITKAMEMVAASKLRGAQDRVLASRPYFETLYQTIHDIAEANTDLDSPYVRAPRGEKTCYVVIAGDRGLAGGYNNNILKLALSRLQPGDMVLPVGKKALEYFRSKGVEILNTLYPVAEDVNAGQCYTMANQLCKAYLEGAFDRIAVCYTNFVTVLTQTPACLDLLPLTLVTGGQTKRDAHSPLTIYEPDSVSVFNAIVPEYLGGVLYGALRESLCSEQAARRTAMDSATKNAEEMIEGLSLQYNRARQGAITQEITEIVAGAEA